MKEETARAVLRLIGVITILVGAILTTTALVGLAGLENTLRNAMPGGVTIEATGITGMGLYAVLAYVLVASWGFALYLSSPALARFVVQ